MVYVWARDFKSKSVTFCLLICLFKQYYNSTYNSNMYRFYSDCTNLQ